MKKNDIAIVLHRVSYSETSLIVTVYSRNNGIQKFLFQGGKKKNAGIFPLSICEITYYHRTDSELGKLTEAIPCTNLNSIIAQPVKAIIAYFIADILRQTLQTNQSEKKLFDYLQKEIETLNSLESITYFPIRFLVSYTKHLGISPDMNENPRYFNIMDGEFHSEIRRGEILIEGNNCQHLYQLFCGENPTGEVDRSEILEILIKYYSIHSPRFNVSTSIEIIKEVLYN